MVTLIVLISIIVIMAFVVMSRVARRTTRRQPDQPPGESWRKIDQ